MKSFKLFTVILALAMVFSACTKDNESELKASGKTFGFYKVILVNGELQTAGEGDFVFQLFEKRKNKPETLLATLTTSEEGVIWLNFSDLNPNGTYRFHEIAAEGWLELEDFTFTISNPNKKIQWAEYGDFPFGKGPEIINTPTAVETSVLSRFNWSNGNTGQINSFYVEGFGEIVHSSYVAPDAFDAAATSGNTVYTVTDITIEGKFKYYQVKVAYMQNGEMKIFAGGIPVDNIGGNKEISIKFVRIN
jgi:hypothetical protein